jgi:uncharacterized protein
MGTPHVIPAGSGVGLLLARGESVRLIDPNGGQSGDLFAVTADGREHLSNDRTFDYGGKLQLSTGDVLWSDRSSQPEAILTAFNFFMNVEIVEGNRLRVGPPPARAGDSMVLRAETDLAVAITACPTASCKGGAPPRPLAYEILPRAQERLRRGQRRRSTASPAVVQDARPASAIEHPASSFPVPLPPSTTEPWDSAHAGELPSTNANTTARSNLTPELASVDPATRDSPSANV